MLAERADEILGERVALVNVSAYLAYPTLFALGLGFGLYVCVVVGVGHSLLIGKQLV